MPTTAFIPKQPLPRAPFASSSTLYLLPALRKKEPKTELNRLEEEVLASVQEKLDVKRVYETLKEEDEREIARLTNGTYAIPSVAVTEPRWKVAVAAATVSAGLSLGFQLNFPLAATVWAAVFLVANRDPLDEDDLAGPVARILGRTTLRSVEASQPKLRALIRAVITEEEVIRDLNDRVHYLEQENKELRKWKRQREAVDENANKFTLAELKEIAREEGLKVGGTKHDLLLRIAEEDAFPEK